MDGSIDQLERARAGDRAAFEALVDLWGQPVFRLAWLLAGTWDRASEVARKALLACWRDLPTLHTERAFRPWLLATVIEVAREDTFGPAPGVLAPLTDDDARVVAALRYGIGLRLGEVADTAIKSLRETRAALASAADALQMSEEDSIRRAVTDDLRGIELEGGFYQTVLARALTRTPEASVARTVTTGVDATWRAACSTEGLSTITGLNFGARLSALQPGEHGRAWGRLGDKARARIEVLVTRVEELAVLTWTERARTLLRPGPIELRFSLSLRSEGADTLATLDLDGVALPELVVRAPGDLPKASHPRMHRGLEALAVRALAL